VADDSRQAELAPIPDAPFERLPDRGPRYKETPPDPYAENAPNIAEPYNAVTASFFVFIVLYWLIRLRGKYSRFPMLVSCLPILLVGGIGGTLYHAYRTRLSYFLLDVIPIQLLALAATIYMVVRLGSVYGKRKVFTIFIAVIAAILFVNGVLFRMTGLGRVYPTLTINLSYASLAVLIVTPILVVLVRTKFRHGSWVALALSAFAIGWFCRLVDPFSPLPMGTHWLWHTFGAISTAGLIAYFYRIEGRTFEELRHQSVPDTTDEK